MFFIREQGHYIPRWAYVLFKRLAGFPSTVENSEFAFTGGTFTTLGGVVGGAAVAAAPDDGPEGPGPDRSYLVANLVMKCIHTSEPRHSLRNEIELDISIDFLD